MNLPAMKHASTSAISVASNAIAALALVFTSSCVVEEIDAILAERGMTYYSSSGESSGRPETGGSTGTSTDSTTGTSTETPLDATSDSTSISMESSSTGSESTGTLDPVCGNGLIEVDETCDDGNMTPGDGCQECAKDSIVFISSEVYQGFALGGLHGADQRCRNLATKANLPNPLSYKAWLSTPRMSAANRLLNSPGRYILVNGLVVAQNWNSLTSGTIETTITVDENSQTQDVPAWTGTTAKGEPALGSEFCDDWDDDSGLLKFGGFGLSDSADAAWSYFGDEACDSELHLYCIEQ